MAVTWWSEEVGEEMETCVKEKGQGMYIILLHNVFQDTVQNNEAA